MTDTFAVTLATTDVLRTAYYQAIDIPIRISNVSADTMIVERVALRFEAEPAIGHDLVIYACHLTIPPNGSANHLISVLPPAHLSPFTNCFDIRLTYRVFGERNSRAFHSQVTHSLVLSLPASDVGRVFISYKRPEDLAKASELLKLANRMGFDAWLDHVHLDAKPTWPEIASALAGSAAMLCLWTNFTSFSVGVEREIALARDMAIPIIAIIDLAASVPEHFQGSGLAYYRFDSNCTTRGFVEALETLRRTLIAHE
ncbi:MAG: toll/interleukin-1 receptor domain-containing protein [Gemmatimonadales bacterium]